MVISRDVVFHETIFPFKQKTDIVSSSTPYISHDSHDTTDVSDFLDRDTSTFSPNHHDHILNSPTISSAHIDNLSPTNSFTAPITSTTPITSVVPIRHSTRIRQQPRWMQDFVSNVHGSTPAPFSLLHTPHIPPTFPYMHHDSLSVAHTTFLANVSTTQ